jgi:hypothetical protein
VRRQRRCAEVEMDTPPQSQRYSIPNQDMTHGVAVPFAVQPTDRSPCSTPRGRHPGGSARGRLVRSRPPMRDAAATGVLALVVLLLIGLGLAQTGPGSTLLRAMGIGSPSEPYTELAFADPANPGVPTPLAYVRVRFWVHNVEGTAQTYRWTATTQAPGHAPMAATTGILALADGESATVTTRIPARCSASSSRISVSLGGAHQTISFWQSCPVPK